MTDNRYPNMEDRLQELLDQMGEGGTGQDNCHWASLLLWSVRRKQKMGSIPVMSRISEVNWIMKSRPGRANRGSK
jgi:hypothetical protein